MQRYSIKTRDFSDISRAVYHIVKNEVYTGNPTEIIAQLTEEEYYEWLNKTTFLGDGETEIIENLNDLINYGIKNCINKIFEIDGIYYLINTEELKCIKISDTTLIDSDFIEANLQYFPEKIGFNNETIIKCLGDSDVNTILLDGGEYNKPSYIEKFLKNNVFTNSTGNLNTGAYFGSLMSPEYELLIFPHNNTLNVKSIELIDDSKGEDEDETYWPKNVVSVIDFYKGSDESGEFDTIGTSKVISLYLLREINSEEPNNEIRKIQVNLTYKLWKDDINGNPKMSDYVVRRDIFSSNKNPVVEKDGMVFSYTSGNLLGNVKEDDLPILRNRRDLNYCENENNIWIWNKNRSYGIGEKVKLTKNSNTIYESLTPNNLGNNPLLSYKWTDVNSVSEQNIKYVSVFCYEISSNNNNNNTGTGGYVSPIGIVKLDKNLSNDDTSYYKSFTLYPDNRHEFKKINDEYYPVYDSIGEEETPLNIDDDDVSIADNGNVTITVRNIEVSSIYFGYSLKSGYKFSSDAVWLYDTTERDIQDMSAKELYEKFSITSSQRNYYNYDNYDDANPELTYNSEYSIAAYPNTWGSGPSLGYYKVVRAVLLSIDSNNNVNYKFLDFNKEVIHDDKTWQFFSDPDGYQYDMNIEDNDIIFPKVVFFGVKTYNITVNIVEYPKEILVENEKKVIDSYSSFTLRFYFYDTKDLPNNIKIYSIRGRERLIATLEKGTEDYTSDGLCQYTFGSLTQDTKLKITIE